MVVLEREMKKKKDMKKAYQKKLKYAEYIKEMHAPVISTNKKKELLELKEKIKHKARSPNYRADKREHLYELMYGKPEAL